MGRRVGSMPCPLPRCGTPDAAVEETGANTLQWKCHRCQGAGFGKAGTRAKRLIEAAMTPDTEDETPPASTAAAPAAAPAATPAPPARKSSGLLIGD